MNTSESSPAGLPLATEPPRPAITRWVVVLALIGLALRLVMLGMPVVEDNSQVRQTYTALAIRAYAERGWLPLATPTPWRGNLDATALQELPVYNFAAAALVPLLGGEQPAGRLVSALLWLAAFFVLQHIWKRFLSVQATLWANLLFVLAPLSVAFGQAVQPEMAVQLACFGFLLLAIRYVERPTWLRLAAAGAVGVVGAMLKLPEISHIYIVFFVLLLMLEKWRVFLRPRYWVLLIATGALMKLWGAAMDSVNTAYFPQWCSSSYLTDTFYTMYKFGKVVSYVRFIGYNVAFILTPLGSVAAVWGGILAWRRHGWSYLPLLWAFSLVFFFLLWGPRCTISHAYYNLPNVAPLAALFGLGVVGFLRWSAPLNAGLRGTLRYGALAVTVAFLLLGNVYLLRPTWNAYNAGQWLKAHTAPEDIILYKANHHFESAQYTEYSPAPLYSWRRTWIISRHNQVDGLDSFENAFATSSWYVELVADNKPGWMGTMQNLVKMNENRPADMSWITNRPQLEQVHRGDGFVVYRINHATPGNPSAPTP